MKAGISRGIPGQNIGYYKRLVSEVSIFRSHYQKKPYLPNAEWARDNVLLFDVHRWHRSEQMKEYAETFDRILSSH